jgi:hypothetical protein
MRLRGLAALTVAAVALAGCSGPAANTPPQVHATVSSGEGAVGEPLIFTGTAYDADGSVVRFEWDFESDGHADFANATRGATQHVFASPGTFTATFTAFDNAGASASATVQVHIIARFTVTSDWGGDDGFLIHGPEGLDRALLKVRVTQTGSAAPIDYGAGAGLLPLNNTTFRIALPAASLNRYNETTVNVTYNGTLGGGRVFRAVPFLSVENDPAVIYAATVNDLRVAAGSSTTVTQDGTLWFHYTAQRAVATFEGTGSSHVESVEGGVNSTADYAFQYLAWNHSVFTDSAAFVTTDYEWSATGRLVSLTSSGFETNITLANFDGRRYLGNLTFERAAGEGTYTGTAPGTNGSATYSLFGNSTLPVTDGNAVDRRALRLTETTSFVGRLSGANYTDTNSSERLEEVSDQFVHTGIFAAWNSTGRVGTTNISDSGSRYLDSDGDGRFNPDPRPRFPFDGQYFNGLAPSELAAGDAFTVRDSLGASVRFVVGELRTDALAVGGFPVQPVQVAPLLGAVSGGGLNGTYQADVVAVGPHSHLRLVERIDLSSLAGFFTSHLVLSGRGA